MQVAASAASAAVLGLSRHLAHHQDLLQGLLHVLVHLTLQTQTEGPHQWWLRLTCPSTPPSARPSHLDSVEQMHPVDGDDLVVLLLRLLRGTADLTALYHRTLKNHHGLCFIFLHICVLTTFNDLEKQLQLTDLEYCRKT